jgi:hypothetical protein
MMGGIFSLMISLECASEKNFKYIGGMSLIGGLLGAYIGLSVSHHSMEQDEFWHEALKCHDDISPLKLSGTLIEG